MSRCPGCLSVCLSDVPMSRCKPLECRADKVHMKNLAKCKLNAVTTLDSKRAQPQIVVKIIGKSLIFFKCLRLHFFNFLPLILVPGRLQQLREARRIHFHLSWYLSDPVVPSYVHFCVFQKLEFHEYLPHEYLNLSVTDKTNDENSMLVRSFLILKTSVKCCF